MSELEKPDLETYAKSWDHPDRHVTVSEYNLGQVATALEAAIERINAQDGRIMTLEAENKELRHLWDQNEGWLVELKVAYEGHTHEYSGHGHGLDRSINYYNDKVTTPPTNNGTRGANER